MGQVNSNITITHLELATSIEQLDWILPQPFRFAEEPLLIPEEVRHWLQGTIAHLSLQSYAHNVLRHFSLVSAKETVPLNLTTQRILQWLSVCIPYFEAVVTAPNFHDPYLYCLFRMQAESNSLSCSAHLVRRTYGWGDLPEGLDFPVSLGELYCHRLKNERCMLHFTNAVDMRANADEEIEINGKTIETLLAEGKIF